MSYQDDLFPTAIGRGARGGPGWKTQVAETDAGAESRVQRWSQPRHRYNVKWGLKGPDDVMLLKDFYMTKRGARDSFRFKDPQDNTTATDGISAPSFLDSIITPQVQFDDTETFQLIKNYRRDLGTFTEEFDRIITKPTDTPQGARVGINGVQQDPASYSVDLNTGLLTFDVRPTTGSLITAGFYFDVECRFEEELDELLEVTVENPETILSIDRIGLVEILPGTGIENPYFYGGAEDQGDIGTLRLNAVSGRVQRIASASGSGVVFLPDADSMEEGGPLFVLWNDGATGIPIFNFNGQTVLTLAAGDLVVLHLLADAVSGDDIWLYYTATAGSLP